VSNGQAVVDAVIKDFNEERARNEVLILIVDYEMPFMTGLQAIMEVRSFYKIVNRQLMNENNEK